jgi:hypothetical protein
MIDLNKGDMHSYTPLELASIKGYINIFIYQIVIPENTIQKDKKKQFDY